VRFEPCHGALADHITLELCQAGKDREHELAFATCMRGDALFCKMEWLRDAVTQYLATRIVPEARKWTRDRNGR